MPGPDMGPGTVSEHIIEFRTAFDAQRVDRENSIIRGVALITKGTARGHELDVDDETLNQILSCANERGQVPVKANHKSGVGDVTGFVTNFWRDGEKLRGDWHLLKSYPQREQFLETAERMPNGVGLSVAFVGPDKPIIGNDGRKKARCQELLACDYVTMPAANPDGLFSRPVDKDKRHMDANPSTAGQEPSMADVIGLLNQLSQRLDASEQANAQFRKEMQLAANPPSLEEVLQMSDEELAEIGLTPDDVQEMIQEIEAQMAEEGEQPQGEQGEGDEAATETTTSQSGETGEAAAAPAGTGAALSRIEKAITLLEGKFEQAEKDAALVELNAEFNKIGEQIDALQAENAMLREANKNAGRAVAHGVEDRGVRYFSRDKQNGAFERKVHEFQVSGKTKNEAFTLARREDPDAYKDYLVRTGIIEA